MLWSFLKFSQLILQGNVLRSRLKICLWIWEYYILNKSFITFIATDFLQACDDNYKWFNHLLLLPHHNVGCYTVSQHPTKLKESETKIQQVIIKDYRVVVWHQMSQHSNLISRGKRGERGGGTGSSSLYICIFRWSKVFIFRGLIFTTTTDQAFCKHCCKRYHNVGSSYGYE